MELAAQPGICLQQFVSWVGWGSESLGCSKLNSLGQYRSSFDYVGKRLNIGKMVPFCSLHRMRARHKDNGAVLQSLPQSHTTQSFLVYLLPSELPFIC